MLTPTIEKGGRSCAEGLLASGQEERKSKSIFTSKDNRIQIFSWYKCSYFAIYQLKI